MTSVVDVEEVRGRLEILMTETAFRGSIRKQIVTLRERNRAHKKRIDVESRVLSNLINQGILKRIVNNLLSIQDHQECVACVKNSESIFPEIHATTNAETIKKYHEQNVNNVTGILAHKNISELKSQVSRSHNLLITSEPDGTLCRKSETQKTSATSLLFHTNVKTKKENTKVKVKLKTEGEYLPCCKLIVKDVIESINQVTSENETTNYIQSKEKISKQKYESKVEDVHMPKLSPNIHSTQRIKVSLDDCENESNTRLVKINPRKRHVHFEILHGKSFLEHLAEESFSMFVFYLYFRGQRLWTQPIPCSSQPKFGAGFLLELHVDEIPQNQMANASQLLLMDEKVHLVLVRTLSSGEKFLVSSHYFEWRQILCIEESQKTFTVELMGVGAESDVTIGVVIIRLTLIPKLPELLTEKIVLSQFQLEKRNKEECDRIFIVYAKTWWNEYLSLQPEHARRIVKLFQRDENAQNRPVFQFVQVLKVGRPILELPQEAAWFVSLIPFETSSLLGALPDVEQWWMPHTFLCLKKGGSENHATLLCSLFLGFGLDAYVCIGTKEGNIPWAWVTTIGLNNHVNLWESTTGTCYRHTMQESNKQCNSSYPYKTIGCMFNHKIFYANTQESDYVWLCSFDITDRKLWKNMSETAVSSMILNLNLSLLPAWTDPFIHSHEVESEIRNRIVQYRWDINLPTRWDIELCHLIAPVLTAYEMEHKMRLAIKRDEINELLSKNIPEGFTFRALPVRVAALNKKRIFEVCLHMQPKCQRLKILLIRFPCGVRIFDMLCASRRRNL